MPGEIHLQLEAIANLDLLEAMIRAKSGDPLREVPAELIVLKHRAEPDPGKPIITRAIYIDDSHMICITTPDMLDPAGKGWRMRFLPNEVSKMVVLYLACVLPFYRTLAPEDAYSTSDSIFAHQSGGIWHTARFERALERLILPPGGWILSPHQYTKHNHTQNQDPKIKCNEWKQFRGATQAIDLSFAKEASFTIAGPTDRPELVCCLFARPSFRGVWVSVGGTVLDKPAETRPIRRRRTKFRFRQQ